MKRCTGLLLGAFAAFGTLATTGAQAADLLDIYREAVSNDAQYAAARAQLEAGKEKLPQGRSGLLPNIGLSAGTSYNMVDADRPINLERDYNSNSYQLRLTQPLFRWQNWVAYRQGEIQVGIAEAQFLQAKSDLIVRTSQAYFDVLYAEDVLSAVSALKTANSEQLGLAKKSFEVGTVTITDVNEAQSRYDLTAAQEIAAQADLEIKRNALRVLTGRDPEVLAKLREGVQLISPQPSDLESWVRAAEQSNPNVQAQNLSAEFAKREVERSRAGHLPTLDLVASNGRNHASGSVSGQESLSRSNVVGLELQLPIYQGGATQSRVREASALYDKARSDLENVRRNAAQLARQSYLGTTSGIAQVKGYEAAMVSGRSSLESNKLGYEVGVRINIDVLNAQTQLADTYAKLQKARYDAIIAQLRLKSAAGSLAEPDVEQVNTLLNR